jgi:uncharacterized delta-60 repeat protein
MKLWKGVVVVFALLGLPWPASVGAARDAAALDRSFGTNGVLNEPGFGGQRITLDHKGRVLGAAGSSKGFQVVRYLRSGRLDLSFGVGGIAELPIPAAWGQTATAIRMQPDGKVLIAGSYYREFGEGYYGRTVVLARLDADGSVDEGFGGFGRPGERPGLIVTGSINTILLQREKIVVAGGDGSAYIGRFNRDGSHDRSFGRVRISLPPKPGQTRANVVAGISGLVPGRGGSLYATGWMNGKLMVARLRVDGRLVRQFGERGIVRTKVSGYPPCHCYRGSGVARDRRGRLLVVGTINATAGWSTKRAPRKVVLARYWPNGSLDRGFGNGGLVYAATAPSTFGNGVAIQRDGGILVVGSGAKGRVGRSDGPARFVVLRFLPDGRLDQDFFGDGSFAARLGTFSSKATQALVQSDGRVVVGGWGVFRRPYSDLRGLIARFRFKR